MDPTWVGLGVNAVLVVITGVYAVLTRQLSKSSAAAARSAAESARSAADSARMQRAAIEAEVNRRHAWFKTAGGGRSYEDWDLIVIPLVGAYVLRKVVLRDFEFTSSKPGEDGSQSSASMSTASCSPRAPHCPCRSMRLRAPGSRSTYPPLLARRGWATGGGSRTGHVR